MSLTMHPDFIFLFFFFLFFPFFLIFSFSFCFFFPFLSVCGGAQRPYSPLTRTTTAGGRPRTARLGSASGATAPRGATAVPVHSSAAPPAQDQEMDSGDEFSMLEQWAASPAAASPLPPPPTSVSISAFPYMQPHEEHVFQRQRTPTPPPAMPSPPLRPASSKRARQGRARASSGMEDSAAPEPVNRRYGGAGRHGSRDHHGGGSGGGEDNDNDNDDDDNNSNNNDDHGDGDDVRFNAHDIGNGVFDDDGDLAGLGPAAPPADTAAAVRPGTRRLADTLRARFQTPDDMTLLPQADAKPARPVRSPSPPPDRPHMASAPPSPDRQDPDTHHPEVQRLLRQGWEHTFDRLLQMESPAPPPKALRGSYTVSVAAAPAANPVPAPDVVAPAPAPAASTRASAATAAFSAAEPVIAAAARAATPSPPSPPPFVPDSSVPAVAELLHSLQDARSRIEENRHSQLLDYVQQRQEWGQV
jgi:hypothetical protein